MSKFRKQLRTVLLSFISIVFTFGTMALFSVSGFADWWDSYLNSYYSYTPSYSRSSSYSYSSSETSKTYDIYTYKTYGNEATITNCKSSASGNIKIPSKIEDYSVTEIDSEAFACCEKIKTITVPDSVTEISYSAFEDCKNLTDISIGKGVTSISGSAFEGCESLTSIKVDGKNKNYSNDEYGVLFNKDKTELIQYSIGNSRTSYTIPNGVTTIDDGAFCSCKNLTSVIISDGVTSIGNEAFENCEALATIKISESVTNIKTDAFLNTGYYNDSSNWENNVLYIDKHLIKAKDSITGSYTIKDETVNIANSAFKDCTLLEEITIPDSITKIRYCAFMGCSSLKKVTIPDSITSIGIATFKNCTSLVDLVIPDNVESINETAFLNVPNVIYSPNIKADGAAWGAKVSNGKVKGCLVFDSQKKEIVACASSATKISIPTSVISVSPGAFAKCKSITDIYYGGGNCRKIKFESLEDKLVLTKARCHYIPFHIFCTFFMIICIACIILLKKNGVSLVKFIGAFIIICSLLWLGLINSGKFLKIKFVEMFTFKCLPISILFYLGIVITLFIIVYPITAKGTRVCWKHVFVLSTLFGYDRFIRGQYGRGIIKMLTFGGLLIWVWIDFFIAAAKAYGAEYRGNEYFTFVDGKYCKKQQPLVEKITEKETDLTE